MQPETSQNTQRLGQDGRWQSTAYPDSSWELGGGEGIHIELKKANRPIMDVKFTNLIC